MLSLSISNTNSTSEDQFEAMMKWQEQAVEEEVEFTEADPETGVNEANKMFERILREVYAKEVLSKRGSGNVNRVWRNIR